MGIGSILVQPQRIRRAASASQDAALMGDVARTMTRTLTAPDGALDTLQIMEEAIEGTAARFQDRVSARLSSAYERLRDLVQPVIDFFQSPAFSSLDGNADAGMELADQVLGLLSSAVEGLTLDRLREIMAELVDIVENDLGLTGSFIEDEIWTFVDAVIDRLEAIPEGASRDIRENRLDVAATLRRAKRRLQQEFTFPRLEAEKLARILLDLLRQTGIEDVAQKAECAAGALSEGVDAASSIGQVVQAATHRSLGAAAARAPSSGSPYAWYATWLLEYKYRGIPLLGPGDLKDARALANKLKSPAGSDAVSRYIRSRFTEQQRAALDAYDGTSDPDDDLKRVVLAALNALMQETQLDDQDAFDNVTLSAETRQVGENFVEEREFVRYNRMILEDAYPQELEQLPRSGGSRFWHWLGETTLETIGWPGEQVRTSGDARYLMLGDKIMLSGTDVRWQDAPIFNAPSPAAGKQYYRFQHISPEFMEGWAWHSTWGNDAIRALWHLLYILQTGRAHFVSSLLSGIYDVGHGLTTAIGRRPFSGFQFPSHGWLEWLFKWIEWPLGLPLALITAGSPQGHYTEANFENRFLFWLTLWLGDIVNYAGPISATSALRNLTLSFMTLLNFRGPQDAPSTLPPHPALNYKELHGIVDAIVIAFTYWLASEVDREEYAHPGEVPGRVLAVWLAGGVGMGVFAALLGTLVAEIVAWAEDFELMFGWPVWKLSIRNALKVILSFWPVLYGLGEGDTDGGKYNPSGAAFAGYPAKPSPYLLPYASGSPVAVGQANQGIFSHNARGSLPQVYAYDFGLDQGVEVLAARPGTVVDFFDWAPDNQNTWTNAPTGTNPATGQPFTLAGQTTAQRWNFVCIRHDDHDPPHDPVDATGRRVYTYASYGHGRNGSVRDAFGSQDPGDIIGQRVVQGRVIMRAGDTGISFYNHLHMHVRTGPGPTTDSVGTGNGTTASFNVTLSQPPVLENTLRIQLDGVDAAADDGSGGLTGANVDTAASSINYATGALQIAWTAGNEPGNGIAITAVYFADQPVAAANLNNWTIPFVFDDVDGDGVCKARHWYESTNTRVT